MSEEFTGNVQEKILACEENNFQLYWGSNSSICQNSLVFILRDLCLSLYVNDTSFKKQATEGQKLCVGLPLKDFKIGKQRGKKMFNFEEMEEIQCSQSISDMGI